MKIYFVRLGVDGPIKIGIANNVVKRISAIQVSCPADLFTMGTRESDKEQVLKWERGFHDIFNNYKIRGEWFYPFTYVIETINRFIGGSDFDDLFTWKDAVRFDFIKSEIGQCFFKIQQEALKTFREDDIRRHELIMEMVNEFKYKVNNDLLNEKRMRLQYRLYKGR
jgi:hypothetical protein